MHCRSSPFILVDLVSKAYSVHNSQLQFDSVLLQLVRLRTQLHFSLVVISFLVFKCCVEKRVDQG